MRTIKRRVAAHGLFHEYREGDFVRIQSVITVTALVLIYGCGQKEAEVAQESPTSQPEAQQEQAAAETQQATAGDVAASGIPQLAGDTVTTESGLKYIDMTVGTGATPTVGQVVKAHYTGWLTDGTKFDSSRDRGQPFPFPLGMGRVIPGWDEGIASMQVGGRRLLIIPSNLGYGVRGAGGVIPPDATLIFDVELLGVE